MAQHPRCQFVWMVFLALAHFDLHIQFCYQLLPKPWVKRLFRTGVIVTSRADPQTSPRRGEGGTMQLGISSETWGGLPSPILESVVFMHLLNKVGIYVLTKQRIPMWFGQCGCLFSLSKGPFRVRLHVNWWGDTLNFELGPPSVPFSPLFWDFGFPY